MTQPVDPTAPNPNSPDAPGEDYSDYQPDYGTKNTGNTKNMGKTGQTGSTSGTTYTPGTKNSGMGPNPGVSGQGDFPGAPGGNGQVSQLVAQLKAQGFSMQQIQQMVFDQTGNWLNDVDLQYMMNGDGPEFSNGGTKFMGNGQWPMAKGLNDPYMQQYFQQQQQYNDARDMARGARSGHQKQMVKMHMIMLQIMMGDIVGAMRSYAVLTDRQMRTFSRKIMKALSRVQRARAMAISKFARRTPPAPYAGNDPSQAARAQKKASDYTHTVQVSTQLISELQNTGKELTDALMTVKRDSDTLWQSYASMRDAAARTTERVVTFR